MFGNVFQSSKSALAFAGAVVVSALMLVGSKESGGVLDKAVTTYKTERASFASNAASVSAQMSTPVIEDYRAPADDLEAVSMDLQPAASASQAIRLDEETLRPIGEVPSPPIASADESANLGGPIGAPPAEMAAPREAVVTSRMIRIEPK